MSAIFPNQSNPAERLYLDDQNKTLPEVVHTYSLAYETDGEAAAAFTLDSFTPESTAQSRVFEATAVFSEQVDINTLPTRLSTAGPLPVSVTAVWSPNKDNDLLTFFASVGELGSELPNNTDIVFDFSGTQSLSGLSVEGEQTRNVSVNYAT